MFIAGLQNNEKLEKVYEETRNNILGIDLRETQRKRNEYYKFQCDKRGLRFPEFY